MVIHTNGKGGNISGTQLHIHIPMETQVNTSAVSHGSLYDVIFYEKLLPLSCEPKRFTCLVSVIKK